MFPRQERSVFAAPDEGAGVGGAAAGNTSADAPKFTQAQVDALINQRFAEVAKKNESATATLRAELEAAKAAVAQNAELAAKVEELENKGKSAEERARLAAEKASKALADAKAAAEKAAADAMAEAQSWRAQYRAKTLDDAFSRALDGVTLAARRDVVLATMKADIEVDRDETDRDGKVTGVRYAGLAKADLAEAAKAWLAANGWAVGSPGGGAGGVNRSSGGAGSVGKKPSEMTREELALAASQHR